MFDLEIKLVHYTSTSVREWMSVCVCNRGTDTHIYPCTHTHTFSQRDLSGDTEPREIGSDLVGAQMYSVPEVIRAMT